MKKIIAEVFFSIGLVMSFISFTLFNYGGGNIDLFHSIVGLTLAIYSAVKLCRYEKE